MVPSVSQRPGSILRNPDLQVAPVPEAHSAPHRPSVEPESAAAESVRRVAATSRGDGAAALEPAVRFQQVAGYDWRLSPDGKALFLTRPKPPERPDRPVTPYMLRDVEEVHYRDKADLTPDVPEAHDQRRSEPARIASPPAAAAPLPEAKPAPAASAPEPPAALRFKEADASR